MCKWLQHQQLVESSLTTAVTGGQVRTLSSKTQDRDHLSTLCWPNTTRDTWSVCRAWCVTLEWASRGGRGIYHLTCERERDAWLVRSSSRMTHTVISSHQPCHSFTHKKAEHREDRSDAIVFPESTNFNSSKRHRRKTNKDKWNS